MRNIVSLEFGTRFPVIHQLRSLLVSVESWESKTVPSKLNFASPFQSLLLEPDEHKNRTLCFVVQLQGTKVGHSAESRGSEM